VWESNLSNGKQDLKDRDMRWSQTPSNPVGEDDNRTVRVEKGEKGEHRRVTLEVLESRATELELASAETTTTI
jgi:hypothetical protein